MGFGFNLFFIFILVPLTGLLLILWLLTRKKRIGRFLATMWLWIIGLIILISTINWLTSKTVLDKKDYYGQYIIDRDYFPGIQSDWQYNHFRFEIKKNDSIYFYVTDKERTVKVYKGKVVVIQYSESARLRIIMDQPTHHILTSNPTTYRSSWSFYLVFNSPKFYNLYFKKGRWKQ